MFTKTFSKDSHNKIPLLKHEKRELVLKLEENEKKINNTIDSNDNKSSLLKIEEIMDIKDRINEIDENIKILKQKKKEYFLDNSKLIFDYFENKKNISINNDNSNNKGNKTKLLNSFFKLNNEIENKQVDTNTQNIVQKYLTNVDDSFIDINNFVNPIDICQYCFKGELIPLEDEGI